MCSQAFTASRNKPAVVREAAAAKKGSVVVYGRSYWHCRYLFADSIAPRKFFYIICKHHRTTREGRARAEKTCTQPSRNQQHSNTPSSSHTQQARTWEQTVLSLSPTLQERDPIILVRQRALRAPSAHLCARRLLRRQPA